jgi:hypothetical protein
VPISDDELNERRATVKRARQEAIDAGLPWIKDRGPLLPTTAQQLRIIDESAASEAYTLAYRPMSWEVHAGAPSFSSGLFEQRNNGRVSYTESASVADLVGARALSLTTFASTLELVGMQVETEAREIRCAYVPETLLPSERLDRSPS